MIILYSLPNCGICNMVKIKLHQKNISFLEKNFSEISEKIQSDHAPALLIEENGKTNILNNPTEINNWIKKYME